MLGSGGREHALAWKISQSNRLGQLYIAPGNAGTSMHGENIQLNPNDFDAVKTFVLNYKIDMVVVGPEDPLVNGIYDFFKMDSEISHIPVLGPSREGAELEGSKSYAKAFMHRHNIPTAASREFDVHNLVRGLKYLETCNMPIVLKADGLAAGKGVLICTTRDEAIAELKAMLQGKFGDASRKVVVEDFLQGIEVSVFILTDGNHYVTLPPAKDYKRIGENDTGLNTGGMGVVSPVPFADEVFLKKVHDRIIEPTVQGLKKEKISYTGVIYFGLMNVDGEPYVIEYNCRFGDPEAEVLIPLIDSDIIELFLAMANGRLNEMDIRVKAGACCTVVMASGGYPESYEKGKRITGIENVEDSLVFHAGTRHDENGNLLTNGGRVLAVTSMANSLEEALRKSYKSIERIHFDDKYCRLDIGKDVMQ